MKKLYLYLTALILVAACDEPIVINLNLNHVNLSDLQVGQKSLYQKYRVSDCNMLPTHFEWENDTLILEVTGTASALFLKESLTEYSESYSESMPIIEYPVSVISEGLLLTGTLGSELFELYRNDTLFLNPIYSSTVTQDRCYSSPSTFSNVALIPNFELGDISQTDKSIVSNQWGFATNYLIYDNGKVCTAHTPAFNDASFVTFVNGWNLIEY